MRILLQASQRYNGISELQFMQLKSAAWLVTKLQFMKHKQIVWYKYSCAAHSADLVRSYTVISSLRI